METPVTPCISGVEPPQGRDTPEPKHACECPVEDWLGFLGHRWNALILWHLQESPLRHAVLHERLSGITAKVLSERLEGLQSRALVLRVESDGFPRTVIYQLTPKALSLVKILDQIEAWSR